MKSNLDELWAISNSDEGRKRLNDYVISLEMENKHRERWVERMWNHIGNDIDNSIEKLLNWYGSDKYRNREYDMGYEPREGLLWILMDVAEKYGDECTVNEVDIYANMFTGDIRKIGSYIIQVMHGQGSVIRVDKIK